MMPEGPAQTFNYMVLGYAVILACITALIASMVTRFRSLQRDLQMLDELEAQAKR